MSNEEIAERILRLVGAKGYKPQTADKTATELGIGDEDRDNFHAACESLLETGQIISRKRGVISLPPPTSRLTGRFRANLKGFGFVIPDVQNSNGDVYVPAGATAGAMTGDRVSIAVKRKGKRRGEMVYEGRVLEVLERAQKRFVGTLQESGGKLVVLPDGQSSHTPVIVPDAKSKDASPGHKVVVEITQFPKDDRPARGVILQVLGHAGEPDVETQSIIQQYQLSTEFPDTALTEASEAIAQFDPVEAAFDREDLRSETIITIDPTDARDFDDAISVTDSDDGQIVLGVHIADVAHFVVEGSELDAEARNRCNSVYFPRLVLPMLPEVLSNGVCSLQEREPRLTKSVFITYDQNGEVVNSRLANTIIESTKRLTYEQASAALTGKGPRIGAKVTALLKKMESLARRILARRIQNGMLRLDLPEADLVFDKKGHICDVATADTSFSHTIIEMFMIEANEAVSSALTRSEIPHLRRIHEAPSDLADPGLRKFLQFLGQDLPENPTRVDIQRLLTAVAGKPQASAVHFAVLRSMRQAEYSPLRVGHWALASEDYCHFTSPIRRYPDLTIHRLVDQLVRGNATNGVTEVNPPRVDSLVQIGNRCSDQERTAEAAERELRRVLILTLLEGSIGMEIGGLVTGVANMGLYVQIDRYLIDGLVRFSAIADDWWEASPDGFSAIGDATGARLCVGDRLEVVIASVDIRTRQLDLAIENLPRARTTKSRPRSMKKGSRKNARRRGAR